MRTTARVGQGDLVCLADAAGDRHLVRAEPGAAKIPGFGVLDLGVLVDLEWGTPIAFGSRAYHVLPPTVDDRVATIERKAQIVIPKDAARIVWHLGLGDGARVLEAGAGSGALTLALAHAVGASGTVTTVEIRQDFLRIAEANVRRAGHTNVTFVLGDVTTAVPPGPYDACSLDLATPELAIPIVTPALAGGAPIAVYTPLVTQAEAARKALAENGYRWARTIEVLERELVVAERGSRPSHDALGHTAYLTFARRVLG